MSKEAISPQATRQVLQEYWRQYNNHPWLTVGAFLLSALGNIFVLFVPPLVLARLVNEFIARGTISVSSALGYVALFGGMWLFGEILWRASMHFLIELETASLKDLGRRAFKRLTSKDYAFYADNFVGSLTKKASMFPSTFERFTDVIYFNVVANLFPVIFASIVLYRYSPYLPLILLAAILITISIAIPIIRRRAKLVALRHEAGSKVSGRLSDAVTNMLTIKSFAKETEEFEAYGEQIDDFAEKFRRAANYHNLRLDVFMSPVYVLTNIAGLITAIYLTNRFGLQAGSIIAIFSYYAQVSRMFWQINHVYRNVENSVTEGAEFMQLFVDPSKVQDVPDAQHLRVSDAAINFHDVGFSYGGEERFLSGLNLYIEGGQRVSLVGPSGGGKTTLTKLILRFVDVDSGAIMIDGQDIKHVTQASLRGQIAYVSQEPLLFHRSLFENIAYGKTGASLEEVIEAAKLAHAHEFISKLPHGYDTLVGERGIKLSGSQRQRVAIARAILTHVPLLVLDEATSALDSESEKFIQEGLHELMQGKTAIVIAHRLSTIKHLDRIVVLDNGKIVQDGTHEELIRQEGLYAKLWNHQSGGFLEDD